MRRTKIIATIGPACRSEKNIEKLIKAGVNVFRINLSHGKEECYTQDINTIHKVRDKLKVAVSIMADTRGPEIRVKSFQNDKANLEKGEMFTLTSKDIMGNEKIVSITEPIVFEYVKINKYILANDGRIKLKIIAKRKDEIDCKVIIGGIISNNKGLTFVNQNFPLEYVNKNDRYDLTKILKLGVEYISASFVNNKQNLIDLKNVVNEIDANVKIIAKIESGIAIKNLEEIMDNCDGVMVARGDLGVEMSFDKLPIAQNIIVSKAKQKSKICVVATEMLESMITNSRPTRAEISDIASAVYGGASAIMLSAETAVGNNPELCVRTMDRIALTIEDSINYQQKYQKEVIGPNDCLHLIVESAVNASFYLKCKAIVCYTSKGYTAQLMCTKRAKAPVVAITNSKQTYNTLAMLPNCIAYYKEKVEDIFEEAEQMLKSLKIVKPGDLFLITTGNSDKINNVLKFQYVK